jgi:hypothetical protein
MILALRIAAYATGWLHLRLDIVIGAALHPIEQSTPSEAIGDRATCCAGRPRRDRRNGAGLGYAALALMAAAS